MIKNILAIVGVSFFMSCLGSPKPHSDDHQIKEESVIAGYDYEYEIEPPNTAEPPPPPPAMAIQNAMSNRAANTHAINKAQRIIKSGKLTLEVTSIQTAKSALDLNIKSLNGYYESENFYDGSSTSEYHLSVRVPADEFDQLVSDLDADFGKIIFKEIHAMDVTEEYIDLEIRLESKLVALDAYRKFLSRAANVEEILNVQREIRKIEEEIEAKKGRLRYLDDQLDYSTLRIDLVEHRTIIAKAESRHFGQQIRGAFISGYDGILNFVIAMAYVWPLWIVLGIIAFVWSPKLKGVFERRSQ